MLLFHAAHHHAEMASFDDDAHALRLDYLLDGFGNLGGEAFLNLQPREKSSIKRGILLTRSLYR